VIQFFSQMLKLPVAAVAAGLEIVARIVRDVQQTFDRRAQKTQASWLRKKGSPKAILQLRNTEATWETGMDKIRT
jgi:hypothetical protein